MENDIIKTATDLMVPVLEASIIIAAEYVKLCGRDTITGEDTQYAMKYCARNLVGKQIGTLFPELQGDSDSEDEDAIEEVDESESPFSRYTGSFNQLTEDIHQAVDTWDTWEPTNMTECMLKGSIDKIY
jgi:hypothetical protein